MQLSPICWDGDYTDEWLSHAQGQRYFDYIWVYYVTAPLHMHMSRVNPLSAHAKRLLV